MTSTMLASASAGVRARHHHQQRLCPPAFNCETVAVWPEEQPSHARRDSSSSEMTCRTTWAVRICIPVASSLHHHPASCMHSVLPLAVYCLPLWIEHRHLLIAPSPQPSCARVPFALQTALHTTPAAVSPFTSPVDLTRTHLTRTSIFLGPHSPLQRDMACGEDNSRIRC